MFRNNIIGAMMFGLPAAAAAAADAPAPSADTTSIAAPDVRVLDTERYVQTQLDWRSYYLNRFGASRQDELPAAPATAPSVNGS